MSYKNIGVRVSEQGARDLKRIAGKHGYSVGELIRRTLATSLGLPKLVATPSGRAWGDSIRKPIEELTTDLRDSGDCN